MRSGEVAPLLCLLAPMAVAGCFATSSSPPPGDALARATGPTPQLARAYAILERNWRAQGLMRTDRGPRYSSAAILARNFADIALRDEYDITTSQWTPQGRESVLKRWDQPIRWALHGDPEGATQLRAEITTYTAELSGLSGVPIRESAQPNLTIFVLSETELRAAAPLFLRTAPALGRRTAQTLAAMDPSIFCATIAMTPPGRATYDQALVILRAELPVHSRSACIQEELAQTMGLANDSPDARHSIFNDDERYATLTWHDRALLRMLYDPRLRPGITRAQIAPLLPGIAADQIRAER